MSLSPRKARIARCSSKASELPERITSSKASSALSFQCQVSSKASICASLSAPSGALNRMLQLAFELNGGSSPGRGNRRGQRPGFPTGLGLRYGLARFFAIVGPHVHLWSQPCAAAPEKFRRAMCQLPNFLGKMIFISCLKVWSALDMVLTLSTSQQPLRPAQAITPNRSWASASSMVTLTISPGARVSGTLRRYTAPSISGASA